MPPQEGRCAGGANEPPESKLRAEIADFLGLTIETVSRQMTRLCKSGVIRIENFRHIIVPDMDELEKKISA